MSYILDALKKAEAERSLGSVPGLHTQPADALPSSAGAPAWKNPWLWTTVAAVTLLAAGAAWHFTGRDDHAASDMPPPSAKTTAAPLAAQAPTLARNEVVKKPAAAHETPVEEKADEPVKAKKKHHARTPDAPAEASTPMETVAVKSKSAGDDDLQNLPDRPPVGAPDVTVSGAIYSASAADRSVIINQRLLREGEQVTQDLTLEKIQRNSVVLNYHGSRYRRNY